MSKVNTVSAVVFGIAAGLSTGAIAEESVQIEREVVSAVQQTVEPGISHAAKLVDRDFHDILASFEADSADGFQFSGCGGMI